MSLDTVIMIEINKREHKYYPLRHRGFYADYTGRGLTGKFYSIHDSLDPDLIDPAVEEILAKRQTEVRDKYEEPATTNMEYGWYQSERRPITNSRFEFHHPKRASWITKIGGMIVQEDEKVPRKPFGGINFKF